MSKTASLRAFRAISKSLSASPATYRSPLPAIDASTHLRSFTSAPRIFAATPVKQPKAIGDAMDTFFHREQSMENMIPGQSGDYVNMAEQEWSPDTRYHLHIYSHKHNTHITFTKPNRDAIISLSCGNIGFKGAGRSSYDAAYQLAAFVMARIQDLGHIPQIENHKLELIYRGFGPGREAVTKAILGSEGSKIRSHIVQLSDSTRLKFGGTRSKKPRRLG